MTHLQSLDRRIVDEVARASQEDEHYEVDEDAFEPE